MRSDKQRIGRSFARHFAQYDKAAVVQSDMAARLDAALEKHTPPHAPRVRRALEIGIGTGFLTRRLTSRFPEAEWWFNDLTPAAFDWIPAGLRHATPLEGDAEALPYPEGLDLLASASALQWFDDLPAFFRKARTVLTPGGLLALATFGQQNLHELAALTGSSPLRYPTCTEFCQLAEGEGFTLLHRDEWRHTLHFDTARDVLAHLRATGVNGQATGKISTPAALRTFQRAYADAFATLEGKLPLTYHPILLLAQA